MSENFIEIKNLEKIYQNGAKAVYDFSLNIKKNEFIVIVGPSGCGKSTTLRMIAGLEDITKGDLIIDNEIVNYKPCKERKIAIVFQSYALYPQMNVYENIAFPLTVNKYMLPVIDTKALALKEAIDVLETNNSFSRIKDCYNTKLTQLPSVKFLINKFNVSEEGAEKLLSLNFNKVEIENSKTAVDSAIENYKKQLNEELENCKKNNVSLNEKFEILDENGQIVLKSRKMTKAEIELKVNRTASILDLGPYLDRLPKQLSGGQMQRVALGRAIVKEVPIFLMDEPLSNLDAKLRLTMRSEIVKLHKKINATTIYVTHDQTEAMTMANRIVVMSKGFIQQIDSPDEIYKNPTNLFVAKFIGSPTINILNGTLEDKNITLGEGIKFKVDSNKIKKIQQFYKDKYEEFDKHLSNFELSDEHRAFILKVLSANASKDENIVKISTKKKSKLRSLFKKKVPYSLDTDVDYISLKNKTNELLEAKDNPNNLVLAIRPENLNITLVNKTKVKEGTYLIKPNVVELLGNEYHIHFTFLDSELIAKYEAKTRIDENSEFILSFSENDFLYFDPITGERIL